MERLFANEAKVETSFFFGEEKEVELRDCNLIWERQVVERSEKGEREEWIGLSESKKSVTDSVLNFSPHFRS